MRLFRTVALFAGVLLGFLLLGASVALAETTTYTISGKVTDTQGTPLASGWVDCNMVGDNVAHGGPIQQDGTYAITGLPAGTYQVRTTCAVLGYVDQWWKGVDATAWSQPNATPVSLPGDATEINFSLSQGFSISGRITDSQGNPIAGASLASFNAIDLGIGGGEGAWSIQPDGTYTITGLPSGTYKIETLCASVGYIDQWWQGLEATSHSYLDATPIQLQGNVGGIDFTLSKGLSISGRITDSEGSPIAGGINCVSDTNSWHSGWADANGNYTIGGLAPGTYKVATICSSLGYLDQWWQGLDYGTHPQAEATPVPVQDNVSGIDFTLTKGHSISGTVHGLNGEGVHVTAQGQNNNGNQGVTDYGGAYSINGLPDGTYTVETHANWPPYYYNYVDHSATVTIQGADVTGFDLSLEPGRTISGTVSAPHGEIITVTARDQNSKWFYGPTDANGAYQISGLPEGTYTVETHAAWSGYGYIDQSKSVTVSGGSLTGVNFALQSASTISGTVSGLQGESITVSAQNENGMWYSGSTDTNGHYQIGGLADGTYTVQTHASWGGYGYIDQSTTVTISGNDNPNVNFTLSQGATITGTVMGDDGNPVTGGYVWVLSQNPDSQFGLGFNIGADGSYRATGLPAGSYQLRTECGTFGYVDKYFDGVLTRESATSVTLGGGEQRPGISFVLHKLVVTFGTLQVVPVSSTSLDVWLPFQTEPGNTPTANINYRVAGSELWLGAEGFGMTNVAGRLYARLPVPGVGWLDPLVQGTTYVVRVRVAGTVLEKTVTLEPNTPAGPAQTQSLPGNVAVTFTNVAEPGYTSITVAKNPPPVPAGFDVAGDCYELETTAAVTGSISVSFPYDPALVADPRILHYEGGSWVDVTKSHDAEKRMVYGEVTSLSPFVVARVVNLPPLVNLPALGAIAKGSTLAAKGSFTDPDSTSWTATVDYGDGSGTQSLLLNGDQSFGLSHLYSVAGTYAIKILVTDDGKQVGEGDANVTVMPPPVVTAPSPTGGSLAGGNSLAITGTGFTGATKVGFGATTMSSGFTVVSDTQITVASAPSGHGTVDVTVTTPWGTSAVSGADGYSYLAPAVSALGPTRGSLAGGNQVVITGVGFTRASAVRFGTAAASSYTVNSDTQITAIAPAHDTGTVDVRVTVAGVQSTTSSKDRFCYVAPAISAVSPRSGPLAGGNQAVITGVGFTRASVVKFGGLAANSYSVDSDTQITAIVPSHDAGSVDVRVTVAGVQSATSCAGTYTYLPPMVTAVSPSSGPLAGGNQVVITGASFIGVTSVKFGTSEASSFWVDPESQNRIIAVAPAHSAGTLDIRVAVGGTQSVGSCADRYTYLPPLVTDVSPATGQTAGGVSVIIRGTGFVGVSAIRFGGSAVTSYTVDSDTQISAVAPAHNAGTVDVRITAVGVQSATSNADRFTYLPRPSVTRLSPASGPAAGGNQVTISGNDFTGASTVSFGNVRLTSGFTVNSSSRITVFKAPVGAGTVDVTVATPGGASLPGSADRYTYVGAAPIGPDNGRISVSPTQSHVLEISTLTLTLVDVLGNPIAGRQVEWSMLGVGFFLSDGPNDISDQSVAANNHNYDVTDAAGQCQLHVKSYVSGQQTVHAKFQGTGADGKSRFFDLSTAVQWGL